MINWKPPIDLDDKLAFLQELYNHAQFMGAMIYKSEQLFKGAFRSSCEFIKPVDQQDEELAFLQYCACIESLYKEEYDRLQVTKLGEYVEMRQFTIRAKLDPYPFPNGFPHL